MLTARSLELSEPALGPLDLDLPAGSVTLLAGPSGSGKSCLLRLLADLDRPEHGRVELEGRPAESYPAPAYRRAVGYLPATPAFGPGTLRHLTGQLERFGKGSQVADLENALKAVGLDPGLLDRQAAALSTGESLRAALALLVSGNPRILLLDEPTGALDPGATALVESVIRERADAGTAVLWVTHDPEQAERAGEALYHLEGAALKGPERDRARFGPIMQRFQTAVPERGGAHGG
ncbi:ABC transporter ATP-binding protein [Thiohalorhabdus sp. Cl-TMA]|uniref:ATP-binding cassette domain-containing protein n=1 Tax=Thiohalorhabdus methylotrophus TaxID=3242694 RepID=A0ABV4TTF8_9GAMM